MFADALAYGNASERRHPCNRKHFGKHFGGAPQHAVPGAFLKDACECT